MVLFHTALLRCQQAVVLTEMLAGQGLAMSLVPPAVSLTALLQQLQTDLSFSASQSSIDYRL